jgi:hypothetical protein
MIRARALRAGREIGAPVLRRSDFERVLFPAGTIVSSGGLSVHFVNAKAFNP